VKTEQQMEDERNTLALLVFGGFIFPPLWILAVMQWLGGAGKQD
jgi:hypothetical protein